MIVEDLEDFSFLVTVDSWGPFHIREIRPKDLYLAQILRDGKKSYLPLMLKLLENPSILEVTPSRILRKVSDWTLKNILSDGIYTVENWMEIAFHLCKQRWDSSIDWLENQPMSKIKLMLEINKKYVQQQEDEMKKASRKRK